MCLFVSSPTAIPSDDFVTYPDVISNLLREVNLREIVFLFSFASPSCNIVTGVTTEVWTDGTGIFKSRFSHMNKTLSFV